MSQTELDSGLGGRVLRTTGSEMNILMHKVEYQSHLLAFSMAIHPLPRYTDPVSLCIRNCAISAAQYTRYSMLLACFLLCCREVHSVSDHPAGVGASQTKRGAGV